MLVPRVNYFFRRRPLNVGPSRISEFVIPEAIKPPETKTNTNQEDVIAPAIVPAITAPQIACSFSFGVRSKYYSQVSVSIDFVPIDHERLLPFFDGKRFSKWAKAHGIDSLN